MRKPEFKAAHTAAAAEHAGAATEHTTAARQAKRTTAARQQAPPRPRRANTSVPTIAVKTHGDVMIDKRAIERMRASITDKRAVAIANANPVKELHIYQHDIPDHENAEGVYYPKYGKIELTEKNLLSERPERRGDVAFTVSSIFAHDPEKNFHTTFAHELGHHIQASPRNATVDKIVNDAFDQTLAAKGGYYAVHGAKTGAQPFFTKYAGSDPREYFAESFALHNHNPSQLKELDPIAHHMVESVLNHQHKFWKEP